MKASRTRGQKAVLHLSTLVPLIFVAERMGLLTNAFWSAFMSGNITGMVEAVRSQTVSSFTGSGVAMTIAGGITVALVTALLRYAGKGSAMKLSRPKAVAI